MGSVEFRCSVNNSHPRQLGVFYGIQATKQGLLTSGKWSEACPPHLNALYGLRRFYGGPSHPRVEITIPAHVQCDGPGACWQLKQISLQYDHRIQLTRGADDAVAKLVRILPHVVARLKLSGIV